MEYATICQTGYSAMQLQRLILRMPGAFQQTRVHVVRFVEGLAKPIGCSCGIKTVRAIAKPTHLFSFMPT